jgi:hypothetical protein
MANEFFDNLGKTISKVAGEAKSKTEDFFAVTKIKGKIAEEKRMIEKLCCKIGHEVYKEYKKGGAFSDALADLCAGIEKHEEEILVQQKNLELFKEKAAEKETSKETEEVVEEDAFEEDIVVEDIVEE